MREEGLGCLGGVWDGRERDRQATEIPRNTDTARRRNGAGGGDGELVGVGCARGRCLYSVQGKDALARAAAQQGRPDTRLEAWLQELALVLMSTI